MDAYLHRLTLEGIPAFILAKGDATAGAVLVKLARMDGTADLHQRVTDPMTGTRNGNFLPPGQSGTWTKPCANSAASILISGDRNRGSARPPYARRAGPRRLTLVQARALLRGCHPPNRAPQLLPLVPLAAQLPRLAFQDLWLGTSFKRREPARPETLAANGGTCWTGKRTALCSPSAPMGKAPRSFSFWTRARGLQSGLVRGGSSRKLAPFSTRSPDAGHMAGPA